MNRDRRLTGNLRGQSDNPIAPIGFELNNPWAVRLAQNKCHARHAKILILSQRSKNECLERLRTVVEGIEKRMKARRMLHTLRTADGNSHRDIATGLKRARSLFIHNQFAI